MEKSKVSLMMIVSALFGLGVWTVIIYVVAHFVGKYW